MSKKSDATISVSMTLDDGYENDLEERIISKVANMVFHSSDDDEKSLNHKASQAIDALMEIKVEEAFSKLSEQKITDWFLKSFEKTNTWGEKTGAKVSMQEMFSDKFEKHLKTKVNADGKPDSSSRYSVTREQYYMAKLGEADLNAAIKETVDKLSKEAKSRIQATVSQYIAEQLAPTIDVPQIPTP